MYVEVYPLTRLPRRFGCFDYSVPDGMTVNVGDLVEVSFRGRGLRGVVAKVKDQTEIKRVAPVRGVLEAGLCSAADISRYERIAFSLGQAPAQIFYFVFKDYRVDADVLAVDEEAQVVSKKVHAQDVEVIQKLLADTSPRRFGHLSPEGQFALASLVAKRSQNTLVIVPTIHLAKALAKLIPQALVLHGKSTPKQRREVSATWIKQGGVLIGTLQAALLPVKQLDAVVILSAANDDYRFLQRNPRVNPRLAAQLLALQHAVPCIEADITPPLDARSITWQALPPVQIVDLKNARKMNDFYLSEKLLKVAQTALQKQQDLLFFFNRKSQEEKVGAADVSGFLNGSAQVVTEQFFAQHTPFPPRRYGVVADLLADLSHGTDLHATIDYIHKLSRLAFYARQQQAQCIIQTFDAQLVNRLLNQQEHFTTLLTNREKYHLPPFASRYKLTGKQVRAEVEKLSLPEGVRLHGIHDSHVEILVPLALRAELEPLLRLLPDHCIIELDTPTYELETRLPSSK